MYIIETWSIFCFCHVHYLNVNCFSFFKDLGSILCFSHVHYWNVKCSGFSHVYHRNVKYFLFFPCKLSRSELVFGFLMYTIESWSNFCFSHIYYENGNYFLFFSHYRKVKCFLLNSCALSKREVIFVFLMYTIKTWSFFVLLI